MTSTYEVWPYRNMDDWLVRLAEGWRLACLFHDGLPVAEFIGWNGGGYWPVVLLRRDGG